MLKLEGEGLMAEKEIKWDNHLHKCYLYSECLFNKAQFCPTVQIQHWIDSNFIMCIHRRKVMVTSAS